MKKCYAAAEALTELQIQNTELSEFADQYWVLYERARRNAAELQKKNEKLVRAIRKHRDKFVDEILDGERELWATVRKEP